MDIKVFLAKKKRNKTKVVKSIIQPGNTDNGCSTCPDRIGGGYGGN